MRSRGENLLAFGPCAVGIAEADERTDIGGDLFFIQSFKDGKGRFIIFSVFLIDVNTDVRGEPCQKQSAVGKFQQSCIAVIGDGIIDDLSCIPCFAVVFAGEKDAFAACTDVSGTESGGGGDDRAVFEFGN